MNEAYKKQIKLLLDNESLSDDIKRGFIFGLVSSNRPTHEMLDPRFLDRRTVFENQFEGMSAIEFSNEDYEATRTQLIKLVRSSLNGDDRDFLLGLSRLESDWTIYEFQDFPSVKWKLLNLEKFKRNNPDSYQQQLDELEAILKQ